MDIYKIIDEYSEHYLICDASCPLVTNSSLDEEALLYNLDENKLQTLTVDFFKLTGKRLKPESETSSLSGGQKVVLMVLLALHSPAEKILFANLTVSLDKERLAAITKLIENCRTIKQDIRVI
jgi:ABC-type lipoprotein export system ATPase subunit